MIRFTLIGGVALLASAACADRAPARFAAADEFERGLCTGGCPNAVWAVRQQEDGTVDVVAAPGRGGKALRARTAPKRTRVTKAALIARTAPMTIGERVTIAFDLYAPAPTPLNSLQLVDLECATCGEGGNPGIRLYLRRGRLRIDRSKIGIAHAWTRDDAPVLVNDRWYHIQMTVRIGANGNARVMLDGREVLSGEGATILAGADHADRIQIGITANSNPVPATLLIDNVSLSAR